jgi:hypothetical protein
MQTRYSNLAVEVVKCLQTRLNTDVRSVLEVDSSVKAVVREITQVFHFIESRYVLCSI